MGTVQVVFTFCIIAQFAIVVLHDLVDIPGLTHGKQVRSVMGRGKLWGATLVNAIFPGVAVLYAVLFWNQGAPRFATNYWVIYCSIALASAVVMWYVPYFRGGSDKQRLEYAAMYAGTRHVLPPRGENPRPNLLHVCIHVVFAITLALAIVIRLYGA